MATPAPAEPGVLDRLALRERILVVSVCLGVWVAAWAYAPYVHAGPTLCPLRAALGLPCPACGLTRAFCSLVSGDPLRALAWNALVAPLSLLFLLAPAVALYELARGRRATWYLPWLFSPLVARICGFVVALYHLARCALWLANGTLAREYFAGSLAAHVWRFTCRRLGWDS